MRTYVLLNNYSGIGCCAKLTKFIGHTFWILSNEDQIWQVNEENQGKMPDNESELPSNLSTTTTMDPVRKYGCVAVATLE